MQDVFDETQNFLEEKPELEDQLSKILEIDKKKGTWTFQDIPLDSGNFGELVARNIIQKTNNEYYKIRDRKSVKEAIEQKNKTKNQNKSLGSKSFKKYFTSNFKSIISTKNLMSIKNIDIFSFGFIALCLFLVFLLRTYMYKSIFRGEDIVLSGNDPYFYRYWVETTTSNTGLFGTFLELPGLKNGEPLMVSTLSFFSELFGGAPNSVGLVLAFYPVISALITAIVIYIISVKISQDRRVGVMSILVFSFIPMHAMRTSLGFADHHPFDYIWLSVTLLGLIGILDRNIYQQKNNLDNILTKENVFYVCLLGFGVGGQTLSWEAGPLIIGAIGIYSIFKSILDLYNDSSPIFSNILLFIGLFFGGVITSIFHLGLGWHTQQVAFAPYILLGGLFVVFGAAEATYRLNLSIKKSIAVETSILTICLVGFWFLLPSYSSRLQSRLQGFLELAGSPIFETRSLFAGYGVGSPVRFFGLFLFIAIFYMFYLGLRSYKDKNPKFLVISIYGFYFLILGFIQRRFAGELSIPISIIVALGIIHIAYKTKISDPPQILKDIKNKTRKPKNKKFREKIGGLGPKGEWKYLLGLFFILGIFNLIYTPTVANTTVIPDNQYMSAKWMDSYSEQKNWSYPENYVFSDWGENRMYNYFVNGQSRSYGFAQTNYREFLGETNPTKWYNRLKDRTGFVVTKPFETPNDPTGTIYSMLHENQGSNTENQDGLEHYRLMYTNNNINIFTLVPGTTITGKTKPNKNYTISSSVSIEGTKNTFLYKRNISTDQNGTYSVTLAHPGTYNIGDTNIPISEKQIINGNTINTTQ